MPNPKPPVKRMNQSSPERSGRDPGKRGRLVKTGTLAAPKPATRLVLRKTTTGSTTRD